MLDHGKLITGCGKRHWGGGWSENGSTNWGTRRRRKPWGASKSRGKNLRKRTMERRYFLKGAGGKNKKEKKKLQFPNPLPVGEKSRGSLAGKAGGRQKKTRWATPGCKKKKTAWGAPIITSSDKIRQSHRRETRKGLKGKRDGRCTMLKLWRGLIFMKIPGIRRPSCCQQWGRTVKKRQPET